MRRGGHSRNGAETKHTRHTDRQGKEDKLRQKAQYHTKADAQTKADAHTQTGNRNTPRKRTNAQNSTTHTTNPLPAQSLPRTRVGLRMSWWLQQQASIHPPTTHQHIPTLLHKCKQSKVGGLANMSLFIAGAFTASKSPPIICVSSFSGSLSCKAFCLI